MDLPLSIDLASQRVVYPNDLGVGVRQLDLVKGNTYCISISFVSGYSGINPAVSGFTWQTSQPNRKLTPLFTESGIDASGNLSLFVASPVLDYAIGSRDCLAVETDISFLSAGNYYKIASLSTVIDNNTGLSPQSEYYPLYGNPSAFATSGDIAAASGVLQNQITAFQSGDGFYYPASNPSGFITGVNLSPYATIAALDATGNALSAQTAALDGQTGSYVLQSQSGQFYAASNPYGFITGVNLAPYATTAALNATGQVLQSEISALQSATGGYVLSSQSGQFYAASNPSGFITGVNLTAYATTGALAATGQALQTEISSLQGATGNYYLNSNPSGFITGVNFTPYATNAALAASGAALQTEISVLQGATGGYVLAGQTGQYASVVSLNATGSALSAQIQTLDGLTGTYYPNNNPSGFATNTALNSSGAALQTEINALQGVTGSLGTAAFQNSTAFDAAGAAAAVASDTMTLTNKYFDAIGAGNNFEVAGQRVMSAAGAGSAIVFSDSPSFIGVPSVPFASAGNSSSQIANTYFVTTAISNAAASYDASGTAAATGSLLQGKISALQAATGGYYLNSNPSGFVPNATFTTSGNYWQSEITGLQGVTGSFYLNTNPSGFATATALAASGSFLQSEITGIQAAVTIGIAPTSLSKAWLVLDADTLTGANNSFVSGWNDSTSHGFNFSQPSGTGYQPTLLTNALNGHNVVKFNGTSSYLDMPVSGFNAGSYTIVMVFTLLQNYYNSFVPFFGEVGTNSCLAFAGGVDAGYFPYGTDGQIMAVQDQGAGFPSSLYQPFPNWGIMSINCASGGNTSVLNMFMNGQIQQSPVTAMWLSQGSAIRIGSNNNKNSWLNGLVAAFAIFKGQLTQVEQMGIEAYYRNRFYLSSIA